MTDTEIIQTAKKIAQAARDDSVSVKRLTNDAESRFFKQKFTAEPFLSYLYEEEQIHYLYLLNFRQISDAIETEAPVLTIKSEETSQEVTSTASKGNGLAGITSDRLLIAVNDGDQDNIISVPLSRIDEVKSDGENVRIKSVKHQYNFNITNKLPNDAVRLLENETENTDGVELHHYLTNKETTFICKECKEEVSPDSSKCPHCGYHPGGGGKGGLWHATALATSFSPVGWAMMAKGAADEARSAEGVAEETIVTNSNSNDSKGTVEENSTTDKIRELHELQEEGILSKEEFEQKKNELLEDF